MTGSNAKPRGELRVVLASRFSLRDFLLGLDEEQIWREFCHCCTQQSRGSWLFDWCKQPRWRYKMCIKWSITRGLMMPNMKAYLANTMENSWFCPSGPFVGGCRSQKRDDVGITEARWPLQAEGWSFQGRSRVATRERQAAGVAGTAGSRQSGIWGEIPDPGLWEGWGWNWHSLDWYILGDWYAMGDWLEGRHQRLTICYENCTSTIREPKAQLIQVWHEWF